MSPFQYFCRILVCRDTIFEIDNDGNAVKGNSTGCGVKNLGEYVMGCNKYLFRSGKHFMSARLLQTSMFCTIFQLYNCKYVTNNFSHIAKL